METVLQDDIMLPELFDALPESVILFKPVVNDINEVVDFEVSYCNNATGRFLRVPKEVIIGQTILTTPLIADNHRKAIFKQCQQVWETGKPYEETLYDESTKKHFQSVRSKINEGIISVTRDKTEYFNAEKAWQEQLLRLTSILDASADGVLILEAVRNELGDVMDFRLIHCNKAGFEMGKISASAIGKTLLQIFPHLIGSEQFELHKKVIDTGLPQKIETTFRNEKGEEYGWFIVSLMKMGDSVVSRFINISEKKKNIEKIEEQADLLKSIFEASINGIFACEAIRNDDGEIIDLKVLKINEAFTRMIGVSSELAEGTSYLSIFPSGKRAGFLDYYSTVIETGENLRKEIFYDDEKIRGWYDVSAVKSGSNGIVVTFTDISQSKLDKQALEESSHYLQDVIDSSQTGILLLSPQRDQQGEIADFRFKTVNQTLADIAGKQPSELVGKLYSEIFTAAVDNGILQKYKEVAEGKDVESRFEKHYIGDGIDAWIDISVKKRNQDLLITFLDFTPLKKLQVEIAVAAEKLSTVINASPAGMFTLQPMMDANGEIEDFRFAIVNQAVATYIGEKAETLTGALGSTYFPAYKTNGLFNIYKDTYLNNKQHRFDFHYEDGYDVYFHIHTVKAGDKVLVTFTDQTALKKLQVQLEASIEELKKSNSSLEEFAYAASHDLQEPLRKINYFAERLRNGMDQRLTEDETRMFERMESAAGRMSRLISDLLTYSQISRNTRTLDTTDLSEIMQQVLSDLETTSTEKKAIITSDNLPAIQGDPLQLRQLFQNLLSNALKYCKSDTPPVISIRASAVSKQVNGAAKSFHCIEITDNGIGFEQEYAERIFKVFQRLHGQSEYPGTGVGLAIVQKVVENHQGVISAEGRPGEGSTFTILLPA